MKKYICLSKASAKLFEKIVFLIIKNYIFRNTYYRNLCNFLDLIIQFSRKIHIFSSIGGVLILNPREGATGTAWFHYGVSRLQFMRNRHQYRQPRYCLKFKTSKLSRYKLPLGINYVCCYCTLNWLLNKTAMFSNVKSRLRN